MSGDARLDLWETLCTCGGARKSPDVRMCRCLAPAEAGLDCGGCGQGVLLIKTSSTTGNTFWGCSMYKKVGCHFTCPFGPPHDRQAAQQLEQLRAYEKRQLEEEALIVDVHEQEWRSSCTCGAAKSLDTFECYMRTQGGCGCLPICPACGEALFLKQGINGKYWKCRIPKPLCGYSKTYEPPRSQQEQQAKRYKSAATATPTTEAVTTPRHYHDTSNSHATASTGNIPGAPSMLSPEQKAMIEAKRQAALAKLKRTLEAAAGPTSVGQTKERHPQSPVPSSQKTALTPDQKTMIEAKRQAALDKVKRTLEAAAGTASEGQAAERHPQSPTPSSLNTTLTPDQKTMIEAKRQAALDKLKRTLEAAAGPTSVGQTKERHPQSPVPSSQKSALTPDQKTMIEVKRQAALEKINCAMGEGAAGMASAGQMLETYPQSPAPFSSSPQKTALTPDQKTMVESKHQAALYKVKRTKEGAAGVTSVSQTSEMSKTTSFPPQESISVSTGLTTTVTCKSPQNEPLFQAFVELSRFYRAEGNYNAAATYHKVSQVICDLTETVTEDNALGLGKGKTKVPNVGKASAEKMHEFVATGRIAKLEEKKAAMTSPKLRRDIFEYAE
jgi:ssDNA-binding Zn-finger/Zn-ribbon topoisomerase 1